MKVIRVSVIWVETPEGVFLSDEAKAHVALGITRLVKTYTLERLGERAEIAVFQDIVPPGGSVALSTYAAPDWVEAAVEAMFDESGRLKL